MKGAITGVDTMFRDVAYGRSHYIHVRLLDGLEVGKTRGDAATAQLPTVVSVDEKVIP